MKDNFFGRAYPTYCLYGEGFNSNVYVNDPQTVVLTGITKNTLTIQRPMWSYQVLSWTHSRPIA